MQMDVSDSVPSCMPSWLGKHKSRIWTRRQTINLMTMLVMVKTTIIHDWLAGRTAFQMLPISTASDNRSKTVGHEANTMTWVNF